MWDCDAAIDGSAAAVVLKLYDASCRAYCGLSAPDVSRKHALAVRELGTHGIPTAHLMGHAAALQEAAVLTQRAAPLPFTSEARIEAARWLAHFHSISVDVLGAELVALLAESPPNRDRILNGVRGMAEHLDAGRPGWRGEWRDLSDMLAPLFAAEEPDESAAALVHGDYFSANLLWTDQGVVIVDWDLMSLGDTMWDLGFLVGADRDVTDEEADTIIRAYQDLRPVDTGRLRWNRDCWEAFWLLRELADNPN